MRNLIKISIVILGAALLGSVAYAKNDKRMNDLVWADDLVYDSLISGATFKKMPPAHSLDILYVVVNLEGQRPISDAAPGSGNYNGGRWWVHEVTLTELGLLMYGGGGMEITNADAILEGEQMGYFEIHPTETFFSCPLVGKGKPAE
ncbi:MAG: hypothetical protein AB3N63_00930 [Puniceicoccaceae bacterium]